MDSPALSPTPPVLGASTVCRSTQGSTPPQYRMSGCSSLFFRFRLLHNILTMKPGHSHSPARVGHIDDNHVLYPFFHHRFDVRPIRLTYVAHAFNYRIAVLRDGVKPAARVGHSRKAARQILDNVDIPWSQQVAVMFQIICALALDVPEVLHELGRLKGVPPKCQIIL